MVTHIRKRRRRWLRWLLGFSALLVLLLASMPIWFPWLLRPALNHFQADYSGYQRLGYTTFALESFTLNQSNLLITAQSARLPLPLTWLWRTQVQRSPNHTIEISGWKLDINTRSRSVPDTSGKPPKNTSIVLDDLERVFRALQEWLPPARLTNGTICFEQECLSFASATWANGTLDAKLSSERIPDPIQLQADVSAPGRCELALETGAWGATTDIRRADGGWQLSSRISWLTNQASIAAQFSGSGWLPQTASVQARSWVLPARLLQLPDGYQDPIGTLSIAWEQGTFQADVTAQAETTDSLPSVQVELHSSGSPKQITFETLNIQTPWLTAALSDPTTLNYSGHVLSGPARLQSFLDLSNLPTPGLTGQINVQLEVQPETNSLPTATFQLNGSNLVVRTVPISAARVQGRFQWPLLTLESSKLSGTNQTELTVEGGYLLSSKTLTNARWHLTGNPLQAYLPTNWFCEGVVANGSVSGQLTNPTHQLHVQITHLDSPATPPLTLGLGSTGQLLALTEAHLSASNATVDLHLSVADLSLIDRGLRAQITNVRFAQQGQAIYQLEQPAQLALELSSQTNLLLTPLKLIGPDRHLHLAADIQWPTQGHLQFSATHFEPSLLSNFVEHPSFQRTNLLVDQFELDAAWTNGPLQATLLTQVTYPGSPALTAHAHLILTNQLELRTLQVNSGPERILEAQGHLPLELRPDLLSWKLDFDAPFKLIARSSSNQLFWTEIENRTGVSFLQPRLRLEVEGTLSQPQGRFEAQAHTAVWRTSTNAGLEIHELDLQAALLPNQIQLDKASARINDANLAVQGNLHTDDRFWPNLFSDAPLAQWQQWHGQAQLAEFNLAALAKFAPNILVPQGTVSGSARLVVGGDLTGTVEVRNANTQPLATLGPVREINALISVSNRVVHLQQFQAEVAGQPVFVDGFGSLADPAVPTFALQLSGTNVPLVRESGLVIRADLDLAVAKTNTAYPIISGRVRLLDSLFLQDLNALRPGGLNEPTRRPPYFNVTQEPYANWQVDVQIEGEEFLNLRTPLFHGQLSAQLHLQGELKAPIALGDLRVDRGTVFFPFANLGMKRGLITLSRQNPYDPTVFLTGETRTFGYNIYMELTGSASEPSLTFTSTPALSSEEILMMLTAGELPRSDHSFSNQERASRLAMFIGRDLLTRFGSNDSSERLIVRSGEDFSEQGKLTYYIEYKLTDVWSIVGEYDRFNALNAGVKWRIYSR